MRVLGIGAVVLLLSACAPLGRPLVQERSPNFVEGVTEHRVRRGDTLYAVAWRYEMDVKTLAAINGLSAPYTIYPGQRLSLRAANASGRGAAANPAQTAATPSVPVQAATAAGQTRVKRSTAGSASAKNPTASAIEQQRASPGTWRWPVNVPPVREFGAGSKGLDFELSRSTAVRAANAGEVVYAGSGLGGYATLVIVRHGGGLLSAYSFDELSRVAEGRSVKVGEVLADTTGAGRAARKLHFEIRKDGEPISPRSLLR